MRKNRKGGRKRPTRILKLAITSKEFCASQNEKTSFFHGSPIRLLNLAKSAAKIKGQNTTEQILSATFENLPLRH